MDRSIAFCFEGDEGNHVSIRRRTEDMYRQEYQSVRDLQARPDFLEKFRGTLAKLNLVRSDEILTESTDRA